MMKKNLLMLLTMAFLVFGASAEAVTVTSPFGWRIHPISGEYKFHAGTDFGYEHGTPIGAVRAGKVVYSAEWGGYGNCVIIEHGDTDYTLYAHCSSLAVSSGDMVAEGQLIAYVGSTGYSTGPHLHLEWWHNGEYCDPMLLLGGAG